MLCMHAVFFEVKRLNSEPNSNLTRGRRVVIIRVCDVRAFVPRGHFLLYLGFGGGCGYLIDQAYLVDIQLITVGVLKNLTSLSFDVLNVCEQMLPSGNYFMCTLSY